MRVGILQCDSVSADLQTEFGDYPDMLRRLFVDRAQEPSFVVYRLTAGRFPGSVDECDAWVFTGSTWSTYDHESWIVGAHDFVRALHEARRPTIGVCFGHQLIARALGGEAEKASVGLGVGVHTMGILEQRAWMDPPRERLSLLVSHQDQITRLPEEAVLLASHDFCPYDMYQIGDHILGLQPHPEFSKAYSRATMERWRPLIGEEGFRTGVASLAQPVDTDVAGNWIVRFLECALGRRGC
jgi:GMP synthase-like glutamine amidotransferase